MFELGFILPSRPILGKASAWCERRESNLASIRGVGRGLQGGPTAPPGCTIPGPENVVGYGFPAHSSPAYFASAAAILSTSSGVTQSVNGPPHSPTMPLTTPSMMLPAVESGATPPRCRAPWPRPVLTTDSM